MKQRKPTTTTSSTSSASVSTRVSDFAVSQASWSLLVTLDKRCTSIALDQRHQYKYTVLLDHSEVQNFLVWYYVQPLLEKHGIRSCSYDHIGAGFSSAVVGDHSIHSRNEHLHSLLLNSGENIEHLIYVGFLNGGLLGISFANTYPDMLDALVLIDPVVPEFEDLPWFAEKFQALQLKFSRAKVLNFLGIERFLAASFPAISPLPEPEKTQYINLLISSTAAEGSTLERDALLSSLSQVRKQKQNTNVPVKIVHATGSGLIPLSSSQVEAKLKVFHQFASKYSHSDVSLAEVEQLGLPLRHPQVVVDAVLGAQRMLS